MRTAGTLGLGSISENVLFQGEGFWESVGKLPNPFELLRYSFFLGFFAFSGYLFSYTITGRVWSYWPFIQTTLTVQSGMVCAGMQWIFFAMFPFLAAFILSRGSHNAEEWSNHVCIISYSLTPLAPAALLTGVPFLERVTAVLGLSMFLYMTYFGYRKYGRQTIVSSFKWTAWVAILFALIRQMFVYVIGF